MERIPKRKKMQDPNEMYDSSPPRRTKQEDLEVTGVSRSGRVRKKSSKLMDFESPDEIDSRYKRKAERGDLPMESGIGHTPVPRGRKILEKIHQVIKIEPPVDTSDGEDTQEEYPSIKTEEATSESDSETGMFPASETVDEESSMESLGSEEEDEDEDPLGMDERAEAARGEVRRETQEPTPSQAQSLYMMEKSSKKKLIIRDGKIVGRMKAQRKDKGKTRFTAYMLWAKEIRQEILRGNPDMDFAAMSKRLGELWATVPNNEKYNWKRRAKRLAVKGNREVVTNVAVIDTGRWKVPPSRSKFINKQTGRGAPPSSVLHLGSPTLNTSPTDRKPGLVTDPVVGPGLYKVVGTTPVDVSAHLRLLGESLTIIGERLKEHEGQIAVSGSLSVLLDSLLCALGPLTCLTQVVPEANGCSQELLNKILDNIAYFMPGL